jgi:hypothetical protein
MNSKLRISERFYEALLGLYPVKFRMAYGHQMRLTFRDACREAHGHAGVGGLLALWLPTLFDLLKSALEERVQQKDTDMWQKHLTAMASMAGLLWMGIGLLWVVASIGEFVLLVRWGSPDSFWDMAWLFPVFVSFILMVPAVAGTWHRYKGAVKGAGKLGLTLMLAGCGGMWIFVLVSIVLGSFGIEQETWPDYVIAACVLSLMGGHILFGIDALKNRLLPRWNVMPLLVGLPTMLLVVPSLIIEEPEYSLVRFELVLTTTFLRFALTGVCWLLMGIAIGVQGQEAEAAATA